MPIFSGVCISGGVSISKPGPAVPGALGTCFCGGYYMGVLCGYYLIVAPNSTGCTTGCQWKTEFGITAGTSSFDDGYTNTRPPMENATHPAGNWTATRTISGFSDWYLPARNELGVVYTNGGKEGQGVLPAGEGFASAFYWSSTESYVTRAWAVDMSNNSQYNPNKTCTNRCTRAFRREPI